MKRTKDTVAALLESAAAGALSGEEQAFLTAQENTAVVRAIARALLEPAHANSAPAFMALPPIEALIQYATITNLLESTARGISLSANERSFLAVPENAPVVAALANALLHPEWYVNYINGGEEYANAVGQLMVVPSVREQVATQDAAAQAAAAAERSRAAQQVGERQAEQPGPRQGSRRRF